MSSKTKIVVLRMKEIIYTAIFIGLGILLISLFLIMFRPKKDSAPTSSDQVTYIPGVYTASMTLGNQEVNIEVTVDADHINSVTMKPLSDSVTTMYPLVQPTFSDLAKQIVDTQSLDNLSYSSETRYTSTALLNPIEWALKKSEVK